MKKLVTALAILAFSGLWLPGMALAQQQPTVAAPPGPTTHFLTRFDVPTAPATFDQIMLVVDFPPGTWTPPHTHGGTVYITVVEGEAAARMPGMPATEKKYKAGETFVEVPGEYLEVGNPGSVTARLLSTVILPKGAALTTNQTGIDSQNLPPGPKTIHRTTIEVTRPAIPFEVVQFLLDFTPGTWTPLHTHGGQGLVTVTAGEATLRKGGMDHLYRMGEFWVDAPDVVHAAGNATGSLTQVTVAFLLPKGATLTTVQSAETAKDGRTIFGETAATQNMFSGTWGTKAAQQWVTEHNAQLGPG